MPFDWKSMWLTALLTVVVGVGFPVWLVLLPVLTERKERWHG